MAISSSKNACSKKDVYINAEIIFYSDYEHSNMEVDHAMEEIEGREASEALLVAALEDIDKVVDPSVSVNIAAECLYPLQLPQWWHGHDESAKQLWLNGKSEKNKGWWKDKHEQYDNARLV